MPTAFAEMKPPVKEFGRLLSCFRRHATIHGGGVVALLSAIAVAKKWRLESSSSPSEEEELCPSNNIFRPGYRGIAIEERDFLGGIKLNSVGGKFEFISFLLLSDRVTLSRENL